MSQHQKLLYFLNSIFMYFLSSFFSEYWMNIKMYSVFFSAPEWFLLQFLIHHIKSFALTMAVLFIINRSDDSIFHQNHSRLFDHNMNKNKNKKSDDLQGGDDKVDLFWWFEIYSYKKKSPEVLKVIESKNPDCFVWHKVLLFEIISNFSSTWAICCKSVLFYIFLKI